MPDAPCDALPERFRTVVRLVEDMSVQETADLLNLRRETVKTRLHAATHARAEVIQIKMEHSGAGTAHVGDTVEWVNADFVAHTATLRGGAWDVLIPVNATRSVVLKAAGQVDYYCKFHPNITGQTSVSK